MLVVRAHELDDQVERASAHGDVFNFWDIGQLLDRPHQHPTSDSDADPGERETELDRVAHRHDLNYATADQRDARWRTQGPICITVNGQKENTGYFSDLQGGVHLINGTHDNTIVNDTFQANSGIGVASGGNGFYVNSCAGVNQPFSPVEGSMGANNTFSSICYANTNIAGLPPSSGCK